MSIMSDGPFHEPAEVPADHEEVVGLVGDFYNWVCRAGGGGLPPSSPLVALMAVQHFWRFALWRAENVTDEHLEVWDEQAREYAERLVPEDLIVEMEAYFEEREAT